MCINSYKEVIYAQDVEFKLITNILLMLYQCCTMFSVSFNSSKTDDWTMCRPCDKLYHTFLRTELCGIFESVLLAALTLPVIPAKLTCFPRCERWFSSFCVLPFCESVNLIHYCLYHLKGSWEMDRNSPRLYVSYCVTHLVLYLLDISAPLHDLSGECVIQFHGNYICVQ